MSSALDSQKSALLFRVQPSQSSDSALAVGSLADFRASGKRLKRVHGADRGSVKAGGAAPDRRVYVEGETLARRFDSQKTESTQEYMVQINSIKKRYKEVWEQRRKQARAATVKLYREYAFDLSCHRRGALLFFLSLTSLPLCVLQLPQRRVA
jgi:hypothetical protein